MENKKFTDFVRPNLFPQDPMVLYDKLASLEPNVAEYLGILHNIASKINDDSSYWFATNLITIVSLIEYMNDKHANKNS